ncbi:MAG: polymer-forming cytoskeletal protein [Sediminibacterium sp. Gen4]|jgi:cytoskeletal protein CcmA (bactofilin family)|uniref:bactofilin family protein n=1 Tax=unclassified Sediminibacterium TaxID=2635961 RepID=UPI0015BD0F3B|nr:MULTISPECIES: polymer-forming cytoskeletal protein [unclassified Sediminibacterium]MBW0161638.1 polymer-forming cytoskeletal protein [Sediminibacterium sp.]MBW0164601.1 polymer-forming cytoskeletal protein [Sediminibacterium sp.]NWK64954.1 polymer-forming cytoskeletal protein [Sediminibacterium sp. Gen4]
MNKFREQLLHDPNTNFGNQSFSEEKLVITKSTNVSGVLDSENDIVLDGNFNGVLYSKKTVHITPSGVMTGVIICNDIKVEGEFEGSLYGLRVNLCKDSVLKGSIHCTIINTEMNQYVDANIKLISLETNAFEASSLDLYTHLKEVFGKNNKDNNYLNIFQEKMSQVKPSNKFYHQTIYVAPNPPSSGSSDENEIIEPDQS